MKSDLGGNLSGENSARGEFVDSAPHSIADSAPQSIADSANPAKPANPTNPANPANPKKPLKIAFFGTPLFAKNILQSLIENPTFEIIALITQEDKPFGRKKELKAPETKAFLHAHNPQIPIFQPQKLSDILSDLHDLKPDILLVVAFGRILPKSIIDKFFCINIHGSILPKYRGASPINAMILNDERFLGVTAIKMSEGLDSGDILGFSLVKNGGENMSESIELLSQMGANLAVKILTRLHLIAPLAQIGADSSHCRKLTKNDGIIRFTNAKEIFLKSLAYQLYPQIALENGLKLFGVKINDLDSRHNAGEILEIGKNGVIVGCESGSIIIESLQAVGKNKLSASDYLNGARLKVGDILR